MNAVVLLSPPPSVRIVVLVTCIDSRNSDSYGSTDVPGNVDRTILSLEEENEPRIGFHRLRQRHPEIG